MLGGAPDGTLDKVQHCSVLLIYISPQTWIGELTLEHELRMTKSILDSPLGPERIFLKLLSQTAGYRPCFPLGKISSGGDCFHFSLLKETQFDSLVIFFLNQSALDI